MARPQKSRRICHMPAFNTFVPSHSPSPDEAGGADVIILTVDEFEVLRLVDFEGITHSECAKQMNISRTTVTEICESARKKVAASLVLGKERHISEGRWELCSGGRSDRIKSPCDRT